MTAAWKAIEALRERRLRIAAQSAAQAAREAARQSQCADLSLAAVACIVRERQVHDQAVHRTDPAGGIRAAALQQAGAWDVVLARAVDDAGLQAQADLADARLGQAAAAKAQHAAIRATARRDAARQAVERDRRAAAERLAREDELRAEIHAQARRAAGTARPLG